MKSINGDIQSYLVPAAELLIDNLAAKGPFKLPKTFATIKDRININFAAFFLKISPFTQSILIQNSQGFTLYWTMLLSYLTKIGVLENIFYVYRRDGYPPVHLFKAEVSAESEKDEKIYSLATHHKKEIALIKCIGELLERKFMSTPSAQGRANMFSASVDALIAKKNDFANPFFYHQYLPIQKKVHPILDFDTSKSILWVKGKNLITKKEALLPAQLTFWRYGNILRRREGTIHEANTSGCAGYPTKTGAIVRSIKEAIQRDGFLCYWLTKTSPKYIIAESITDATAQHLLAEFKAYKFDVHILDTTTNIGLPSITIVAIDRASARPRLYAASASDVNCSHAIVDALYEMYSLLGCFDGEEIYLPKDFRPFLTQIGKKERIKYLHGEDIIHRVKWFFEGEPIAFDDFEAEFSNAVDNDEAELKHILGLLRARGIGYSPYIYEVESPVLRTLGYHIVRTIIPKLMPLYLFEIHATLDSERLREFAQWKNKNFSPHDLLSGVIPPHPFP